MALAIVRDRFIRTMCGVILHLAPAQGGCVIERIEIKDTKAHRSVSSHPVHRELISILTRRWREEQVLSHALLSRFYLHGGRTKGL